MNGRTERPKERPKGGPPVAANRPPLKPAYLILGDDLPKIESALKRLKARIVEQSGSDLNIDEFNAGAHSAAEVVNAANTMAFFAGTRLVLVRDAHSWLKADKVIIGSYLEAPAPDACLALVAEKIPAGDPLRFAMEKHGDVLEYKAPRERELPQWLVAEAGRRRVKLGLNEARFLVRRCGDNQNILLQELEKLGVYTAGEPVTMEDIRLLTTATVEAGVFDLLDSLALGQAGVVFSVADDLISSGERADALFYRMLRHFQNLGRVAAFRDEGMSREAIRAELKMKPYPAGKLVEQASLLGADGIAQRLAVLADTDARMKGMGTLPPELELQLCLGRMLAA